MRTLTPRCSYLPRRLAAPWQQSLRDPGAGVATTAVAARSRSASPVRTHRAPPPPFPPEYHRRSIIK